MLAWLRPLAPIAAFIALALLALCGPGVRFDLWSYRVGFVLLRWAAYIAIAAAVLGVLALGIPSVRRRGIAMPILALILGLAVLYVPLQFLSQARAYPPINDISTDTENPPRYMTTERPYLGADAAQQQRAAYPDLAPVLLPLPPCEAFAK